MSRKNNLEDVYMNLSRKDKNHIKKRNKIVTECNVSTPIFYNWLRGLTPVPTLAQPIIAEILGVSIEILFPENELLTN